MTRAAASMRRGRPEKRSKRFRPAAWPAAFATTHAPSVDESSSKRLKCRLDLFLSRLLDLHCDVGTFGRAAERPNSNRDLATHRRLLDVDLNEGAVGLLTGGRAIHLGALG